MEQSQQVQSCFLVLCGSSSWRIAGPLHRHQAWDPELVTSIDIRLQRSIRGTNFDILTDTVNEWLIWLPPAVPCTGCRPGWRERTWLCPAGRLYAPANQREGTADKGGQITMTSWSHQHQQGWMTCLPAALRRCQGVTSFQEAWWQQFQVFLKWWFQVRMEHQ